MILVLRLPRVVRCVVSRYRGVWLAHRLLSAGHNRQLSQQRAETVVGEIVKMGFPREQIEAVAAGGVDTLSPTTYNRRATVEIIK